jgi:ribonuclease R
VLDAEARKRGNSVYLADRVIPMLPECLSNGLCSLVPGEDRLTRLALMEFDSHGRMVKARFASAVIRSARRYSYEEAFAVLQGAEAEVVPAPDAMLHEAWRLASRLRQRRFKAGALDLDFPEVKVVLDDAGRPIELRKIVHDISHQMIEEFMLAANEAVAKTVRDAGIPCLYRVHEDPDEEKLEAFRELAKMHGFSTAAGDGRQALQSLLRRIRGTPEEHALKLSLLKSMKRAVYAAEPRGHYGLAKANYLHFTSPIRRYADLVAHRALGKWHGHHPSIPCRLPGQGDMTETAVHVSATERVAAEAEIESRRMKEMEYFERLLVAGEPREFPAVVNEVRRSGLFIELVDVQVSGLVPPSGFPPGNWWYHGEAGRWQQSARGGELRVGSTFLVRIARVDKENRFLDFQITG